VIPKLETRDTERRRAGREVFSETIKRSQWQSNRSHDRPVAFTRPPGLEPRGRSANSRERHWFPLDPSRMVASRSDCGCER